MVSSNSRPLKRLDLRGREGSIDLTYMGNHSRSGSRSPLRLPLKLWDHVVLTS
jgi:hypothetical protein